jgi:hypothetical protein
MGLHTLQLYSASIPLYTYTHKYVFLKIARLNLCKIFTPSQLDVLDARSSPEIDFLRFAREIRNQTYHHSLLLRQITILMPKIKSHVFLHFLSITFTTTSDSDFNLLLYLFMRTQTNPRRIVSIRYSTNTSPFSSTSMSVHSWIAVVVGPNPPIK